MKFVKMFIIVLLYYAYSIVERVSCYYGITISNISIYIYILVLSVLLVVFLFFLITILVLVA